MGAMRVCAESECPELVERGAPRGRCLDHSRELERRRGTKAERGYGYAHRLERKKWARIVAQGKALCWRCGRRLSPLEPFDLGHLDDRSGYGGAECLPCNRATASR